MEESGQNEAPETLRISAVPEFAQIYSFLDYFGRFLGLPPLPLSDLETFFRSGERGLAKPPARVPLSLVFFLLLKNDGECLLSNKSAP